MSVGLGGRNMSLSLSRIAMTFPRFVFLARETKKGDGGPAPSHIWAANFLAAYVFSRLFCRDLRRRVLGGRHGYERATLETGLEGHVAVAKGKKGVILTDAHILAWPEFRAALTHDHVAAGDLLAAEHLHAQTLTGRVTTVTR